MSLILTKGTFYQYHFKIKLDQMKMLSSNNLHITLTEFRNESRVLKETASIVEHNISKQVYIAALQSGNLSEYESISSNIELKRFKLSSRNLSKNLLVQLIKYLELVFRVAFFYRKKKIDMVNIHGLEILPLGVLLKYWYGAKLIYDTHELETETNGLQGIKKKLSKWIERLFIKQANQIFVVSESIADWYANEYGISRPVVVLNAPRRLLELKHSNYFRERFSIPKDSLIILYQGGLAKGRGVDLLLAAFKVRTDDRVVIIFMGYGELKSQIQ